MATRNLTVMFTDIKGFTERTAEETRRGVADLLEEHHRLLVPVFDYFDGTVAKTIGDAFLVYFESPTDAVLCGVTIQEVLRRYNETREEAGRLEVRVAINVGEVELKENDVHGEAVNIAARLEGVTEPGEVWFTDAVYQTMNRKEAPSSEVGERIFKGIPFPIRVYKVIQDPGSSLAQTLASGVELTAEGPRLRGIRERINGSRRRLGRGMTWAAVAVLLGATSFWALRPSVVERSTESARELLAGSDFPGALDATEEGLRADPVNEGLRGLALEAAEAQAEHLERTLGSQAALEWLAREMESKPFLESARPLLLKLEARSAVEEVLTTPEMATLYYPEPLESLVARYPDDPEVPYEAAILLSEEWHPMTVLWLFRLALERGGYGGDARIFEYCTSSLMTGRIYYPRFEAAEGILLEFFPERVHSWAVETVNSESVQAFDRAWNLLGEMNDPLREDAYYQALRQLTQGGEVDMESLYRVFVQEENPARRGQVVAIHREMVETFPRFTPYRRKRDQAEANLGRLREAWGWDPEGEE